MPKTAQAKAYDAAYGARPDQVRKRAMRNAARQLLEKQGLVQKGDGKDVDHIKPLGAGGTNKRSNLRVLSAEQNRGWRKGESTYKPKKA